MSIPQQKKREILFQLLYSYNMGAPSHDDMSDFLKREFSLSSHLVDEAQEKVQNILKNQAHVDTFIREASTSYDFERIQSIELNILRLAVFELLFHHEIPPKVAIAEALRLTKKFSTPAAVTFVNGLLDNIYKKHVKTENDASS